MDRKIQAALLQPKKKENVGVVRRYLARTERDPRTGEFIDPVLAARQAAAAKNPRARIPQAGNTPQAAGASPKKLVDPLTLKQRLAGNTKPRSIVDVPKSKLGPKLLLDTR
jgi:hypothetical protein